MAEVVVSEPFYVAVDFDGTIVEHDFPAIGAPAPGAIEWLKRFKAAGATLILWTMRSGDHLYSAARWLKKQGVDFDHVNEKIRRYSGDQVQISRKRLQS